MSHAEIAARSAFLSPLPARLRAALLARAEERRLDRDQVIITEGTIAEGILIVLDGVLKLSTTDQNGTEAVLGFYGAGESLGEGPVFIDTPYPVDATAIRPSTVMIIPRAAVQQLVFQSPEAMRVVLAAAFRHLRHMLDQLRDLKTLHSAERLASFLLGEMDGDQAQALMLDYDKSLLAGYLGVTPETLSRAFRELGEHGVRVSGRAIAIDDPAALCQYRYRRQ